MSAKNLDRHNRWRSKTVAFRVSPEEDVQIETAVRLSGLTKQDYITRRLLCREIVVQGNPRVYKALRNELTPRPAWVPFVGVHGGQLIGVKASDYLRSADLIVKGLTEAVARYEPDGLPMLFDFLDEVRIQNIEVK